jgi:hypothetical protein
MLRSIGLPELFVLLLLLGAIALPFWKIFEKAGFPGIMSLTMLVPLLNVLMLFFLAFSEWPALRSSSGGAHHNSPSPIGPQRPQRGVVYTDSELAEFKRQGLM